jgi:hypothetical protein
MVFNLLAILSNESLIQKCSFCVLIPISGKRSGNTFQKALPKCSPPQKGGHDELPICVLFAKKKCNLAQ